MISWKKHYKKGLIAIGLLLSTGASVYAQGDAKNGEKLFKANCTACHALDKQLVGPALGGVVDRLKTEQSQSFSQTATLEKQHGFGGWLLSYSYKNEPRIEQSHELNAHKGYCQIVIDKSIAVGDASYFNNNGRKTFGIMNLERINND